MVRESRYHWRTVVSLSLSESEIQVAERRAQLSSPLAPRTESHDARIARTFLAALATFSISHRLAGCSRSIVTTPNTWCRPTPSLATSNKHRKHSCRPSCLNPDRLAQHGNPSQLGRSSGQLVFCAENESSCRRLRQRAHLSPKFRGPGGSLHSRPPRASG